jgi:acyl dehydratase
VVEGRPYRVTGEEIAAFAAATNDSIADCLDGGLAPPLYAINPVLSTMVAAKKAASEDFGFHGEHDFSFVRPILPGMDVTPRAEVIGIHQRSTGVTITVRVVSEAAGELLNTQYFVSFVPRARIARSVGVEAPGSRRRAALEGVPFAVHVSDLKQDQTRRYAAASNDHDAYTTDEAVARKMGFPGLVVHGMLTVALSAGAVVKHGCAGDPTRLRRLAVRMSRPLYLTPGQRVTTRLWRVDGPGERGRRLAFDAQNRDGETVLTHGLAETAG